MVISVGMLPRCNVVTPATDGIVSAIVVDPATGDVYFGGSFTTVNGQARSNLAAITKNGKLKPWNPGANAAVSFMRWTSSGIIVLGSFTTIASGSRAGAAIVDTSAALQAWDPNVFGGGVLSADIDGAGVIFIGGTFTSVRGVGRSFAAAVDTSNVLKSWTPTPDAQVNCVRVTGTLVYLGGAFTQVVLASTGSVGTRKGLACINGVNGLATDGQATAFDANLTSATGSPTVGCLDIDSLGNVYFGGTPTAAFSTVLGTARLGCASVTSTPSLNAWYPNHGDMLSVFVDGTNVYWRGALTVQVGCMTTSAVDQGWDIGSNLGGTQTFAFASDGAGVIWVGGNFTTLLTNQFQRMHIAKFKDATVIPAVMAW